MSVHFAVSGGYGGETPRVPPAVHFAVGGGYGGKTPRGSYAAPPAQFLPIVSECAPVTYAAAPPVSVLQRSPSFVTHTVAPGTPAASPAVQFRDVQSYVPPPAIYQAPSAMMIQTHQVSYVASVVSTTEGTPPARVLTQGSPSYVPPTVSSGASISVPVQLSYVPSPGSYVAPPAMEILRSPSHVARMVSAIPSVTPRVFQRSASAYVPPAVSPETAHSSYVPSPGSHVPSPAIGMLRSPSHVPPIVTQGSPVYVGPARVIRGGSVTVPPGVQLANHVAPPMPSPTVLPRIIERVAVQQATPVPNVVEVIAAPRRGPELVQRAAAQPRQVIPDRRRRSRLEEQEEADLQQAFAASRQEEADLQQAVAASILEAETQARRQSQERLGLESSLIQEGVPDIATLPFEDLEEMCAGFPHGSQLGRGAFATVYRGVLLGVPCEDQINIAVKVMDGHEDVFRQELSIMKMCRHPNIVPLIFAAESDNRYSFGLVMPLMPDGSLDDVLRDNARLQSCDTHQRLSYAKDIFEGLGYLHAVRFGKPVIVHRDIKPDNVLLEGVSARLADVGVAKAMGSAQAMTLVRGTPIFLDPEYASSGILTTKSDIYSAGVVLFQLLAGKSTSDLARLARETTGSRWEQRQALSPARDIADTRIAWPGDRADELHGIATGCASSMGSSRPEAAQVCDRLALLIDGSHEPARADEVRTCVICLSQPRQGLFRPCGHSVACQHCADVFIAQRLPCPVCRVNVGSFVQGSFRDTFPGQ